MKLTIRQSENLPDWYLIERAEHDGRRWDERTRYGTKLCTSARLCGEGWNSADIEGSAAEMLDLAAAIEGRREEWFKRCSVDARREPVLFGSPRNDNGVQGEATWAEADELAAEIRRVVEPRS